MKVKLQSDFYKWKHEDRKREKSEEVDFGVCWGLWSTKDEPFWRVSWIEDTGELYARCSRDDSWVLIEKISNLEKVKKRMEGFFDVIDDMIVTKFFGIEVEKPVREETKDVEISIKSKKEKKIEKKIEEKKIGISEELKKAIKENKIN